MFGVKRLQIPISVFILDRPGFTLLAILEADDLAAHLNFASHRNRLIRTRFPHHTRPAAWITKRVDESLDHFGRIFRLALRQQCVLDRASEGKSFDSLSRPIGRYFITTHSPHLLGVTLEKRVEESLAELIANPIFKISRVPDGKYSGLHP